VGGHKREAPRILAYIPSCMKAVKGIRRNPKPLTVLEESTADLLRRC